MKTVLLEILSALPLVAGGASAAGVIGLAVRDARADAASAARAVVLREDVEVLPWPEADSLPREPACDGWLTARALRGPLPARRPTEADEETRVA